MAEERNDDPPYTVEVRSDLDAGGVWNIHARLRYSEDANPDRGSKLFAEGSRALMEEIAEAGREGRRLGARAVQLHLDVPGEKTTIDLGDKFPDPIMLDD